MYLGFTLMLLGVALLLGSLWALLPVFSFPPITHFRFIRHEEQMLAKTFGEEWKRYCRQVRRWL
jgi:protein-S-isoprenylcysteine O-methyltransferase Ste14